MGGVLATFIALIVGLTQLRNTTTAANAARDAAERTARDLAANQALFVLPQLQSLEARWMTQSRRGNARTP